MLVTTRAVNVDAFRPCSAQTVKYASSAPGPAICVRLLTEIAYSSRPAMPRCAPPAAGTGSRPSRRRANAPTTDGASAISSRAWSAVGGQSIRRWAPNAENPVRSASRGAHEVGRPRSADNTVGGELGGGKHIVAGRPLAVQQQSDHAVEAAVRRQVADLVASVQQPPSLAVDQADGRLGGEHALKSAVYLGLHEADCTGGSRTGCRGCRSCDNGGVKLSAKQTTRCAPCSCSRHTRIPTRSRAADRRRRGPAAEVRREHPWRAEARRAGGVAARAGGRLPAGGARRGSPSQR